MVGFYLRIHLIRTDRTAGGGRFGSLIGPPRMVAGPKVVPTVEESNPTSIRPDVSTYEIPWSSNDGHDHSRISTDAGHECARSSGRDARPGEALDEARSPYTFR